MANLPLKFLQYFQTLIKPKVLQITLHALMLLLCLIGSVIFIFDFLEPPLPPTPTQGFFSYWSLQMLRYWLTTFFNFIKIKILVPLLIFAYFYFCAKQKVFEKLLKDDYNQKYIQKYSKIHEIDLKQQKSSQKQANFLQQSSSHLSQSDETKRNLWNNEGDSSLNMSKDLVKSINRSMLGSMRSIGNSNMTQSMIDKGNLSMRSSKLIQNLSKKLIEGSSGKDLSTLFQKNKNMSESFMSMSSSYIEGEDTKIRIKNKKYYDFLSNFTSQLDESQGQQFKKWYEESNSKYLQQLKANKKDSRSHQTDLLFLKRGLEKQFSSFLKEYKENTEAVKECIIRFWSVKIETFESKKPFKTAYELSTLFRENSTGNTSNQKGNLNAKDTVISQEEIFKPSSSPGDFVRHINRLKLNLRNIQQKQFAENELILILSKRCFLNRMLNIKVIEGELFSSHETSKIKTLEKALNALTYNKIDIFNFSRSGSELTEMDLLEEYDVETIKELVELRVQMLTFVVNKINLMSTDNHFKVKMKFAVTFDSGFLNTAINFFKNKNFAEIECDKSFDSIFSHFNLKVFRKIEGQESEKESLIYCKPGIDNSISVILALAKEICEDLSQSQRFDHVTAYEDKRKEKAFKEFIQKLYMNQVL